MRNLAVSLLVLFAACATTHRSAQLPTIAGTFVGKCEPGARTPSGDVFYESDVMRLDGRAWSMESTLYSDRECQKGIVSFLTEGESSITAASVVIPGAFEEETTLRRASVTPLVDERATWLTTLCGGNFRVNEAHDLVAQPCDALGFHAACPVRFNIVKSDEGSVTFGVSASCTPEGRATKFGPPLTRR